MLLEKLTFATPGLREGSQLIWAHEEQNLYYKNSYSKSTDLEAYTCYESGCNARVYIRNDNTAYRFSEVQHAQFHGKMYTNFKYMQCIASIRQNQDLPR